MLEDYKRVPDTYWILIHIYERFREVSDIWWELVEPCHFLGRASYKFCTYSAAKFGNASELH